MHPANFPAKLELHHSHTSATISDALRAESIRSRPLQNIDGVLVSISKDRPALAIIEHDPPRMDGIAVCRALRRHAPEHRLPVLLLAEQEDADAGAAAGVSDWLIKPFTPAHARTKVRTWLLRSARKRIKGRSDKRVFTLARRVATATSRGADEIESLVTSEKKLATQEQPGISSEKAALLWMYGREIAAFDTPAFSNKLGRIIAQATSRGVRKAG